MDLEFTWDPNKASLNERKHGITFDEAVTVFVDEHALLIPDPDHSSQEERFLVLGMSFKPRILMVCHCYRKRNEVIRIISARKASRAERQQYEQRRKQ
jgi:uncharacterized DUF497 family protein